MNCDEVVPLLAAAADGEVDPLRTHALHKHVAGCESCSLKYAAMVDLKRRLRAELPYHAAPAALRARLVARAAPPAPARPPWSQWSDRPWRWFGGGVLVGGLAAGLIWGLSAVLMRADLGRDLSASIVARHTRATLAGQLVEVASSDHHKVKPWLSARLDYSIPVDDWAKSGFPLVGARIDRLEGRPVATLVYRRRDHVIDVFVRPLPSQGPMPAVHPVRGFNIAIAAGSEMEWFATSDLNPNELAAFVQGLARGAVAPPN